MGKSNYSVLTIHYYYTCNTRCEWVEYNNWNGSVSIFVGTSDTLLTWKLFSRAGMGSCTVVLYQSFNAESSLTSRVSDENGLFPPVEFKMVTSLCISVGKAKLATV